MSPWKQLYFYCLHFIFWQSEMCWSSLGDLWWIIWASPPPPPPPLCCQGTKCSRTGVGGAYHRPSYLYRPCGGCRLPSNTGLRWAEEGERARDYLFAWERAREGEAGWRVNVSLARIRLPTGRRSGSWQCRKSPAAAGANAHTHPAVDQSTWSRTRPNHKHDVMLQVWATVSK